MVNNLLKTIRIILVRIDGTKAILFTKNPCSFQVIERLQNNSLKHFDISGMEIRT
jgi:hypothetical protein